MSKISQAELHRVLNNAIAKVGKCSGECVNEEMSRFGFEYNKYILSGAQLSLFDDPCPTKDEVRQAISFCDDLEQYRLFSDPYIDDEREIDEKTWRKLYTQIQYYRPYTNPENLITLDGVESNAKHHLPEFRPLLLLQDYNKRTGWIFHEKKVQQNLKKKKEPNHNGYEKTAAILFEDILANEELKAIAPCKEKIELFQNCLKLVDCLPKEKYGRIKKFRFKQDINFAIMKDARALGENELFQKAHAEMNRFKIAEEQALSRSSNEHIQREIRNKRMKDDWDYK